MIFLYKRQKKEVIVYLVVSFENDDELKLALARAEELWETSDVEELAELDALATLISDYEMKY